MASPKKGLGSKGRGLEALISRQVETISEKEKGVTEVDINKISPDREQPRRYFDETALEELAESIRQVGIIQPIILARDGEFYKIIAGERRWRAAKIAGVEKVPAIIKDYEDSFAIALIENLQRENLNAVEEAAGYKRLIDEFGLSQDEAAKRVGKSRPAVANALRLLNLDERVQQMVLDGKLSAGHARALLGIEDGDVQFEAAEKVVENGMSVRAVEALVKSLNSDKPKEEKNTGFNTTGYKSIEKNLKDLFGTKVKLNCKKNKGKIEIEYYSDADLERILELIKKID